jgi:pseudaminic acid cytidylyltransferase
MRVAVIPARGGSKRIPRKNIKPFAGKPMIAYAIEAAQASGLFEHILVSTDDGEIAEIAQQWRAEIPFIRPSDLADDYTGTVPVIAHAIEALQQQKWEIEYVCCIYPAVPLIQVSDIQDALELLKSRNSGYTFPVAEFPSAVQRALRRCGNGRMQPFYPENEACRTQDLEPSYYDAGQFYWGNVQTWMTGSGIHSEGTGLVIPNWRVVDVDTQDDWERAELLYKVLVKS